jgi:hypothetical protein
MSTQGLKKVREYQGIGAAKYVVSFHDGAKRHSDGSEFFDIRIFTNKKMKDSFIRSLRIDGYREVL